MVEAIEHERICDYLWSHGKYICFYAHMKESWIIGKPTLRILLWT